MARAALMPAAACPEGTGSDEPPAAVELLLPGREAAARERRRCGSRAASRDAGTRGGSFWAVRVVVTYLVVYL